MSEWVNVGAPKDKLVMTLPFFGLSWTLVNEKQNGVNDPTKGRGIAGPFLSEPGKLGYNEMAVAFKNDSSGWVITTYGNNSWQYATKGDQWVSYETPATCETKAKWVARNGFAGVAVMAVNNDDFNALASPMRHPLLTAVNKGLHS
ncbi:unnamed protein product [Oppiella nova]|uniref:GH18 domain-containing protein n=1 Tax=Oppiella nova TaxID=334625 RepID=A0A7R9MLZ0_9ACAR|nr:unnamed protein product [Oppiella nova]CAG2179871.1 unnamed protein product [Oppiella nova]